VGEQEHNHQHRQLQEVEAVEVWLKQFKLQQKKPPLSRDEVGKHKKGYGWSA
jgi:hypothetical protein